MVEMRTNINNALTTVLGNAELLALEPGLPATVLAQAERIRRQLGAGIFDLIPAFELGDRTLHSLELFASKVLPQLRDSA